jgi:hypothetical protein
MKDFKDVLDLIAKDRQGFGAFIHTLSYLEYIGARGTGLFLVEIAA